MCIEPTEFYMKRLGFHQLEVKTRVSKLVIRIEDESTYVKTRFHIHMMPSDQTLLSKLAK
jgi:hypothetical protein